MKKLLFITGSLASGGAERQMVTISILLKRRGYNVSFVCYNDDNFYESLLEREKIPVSKILNYRNNIHLIIKMRQFVRNGKFDVVVSFLPVPNLFNCISAIGRKNWLVITGERSSKISTFKSLRGRMFSWLLRYSDFIVCNSEHAKDMWTKYYPSYSNKLRVIYNTIQIGNISDKYLFRYKECLHILVAASFQDLKNPILLAYAISKLKDEYKKKLVVDWYGRTNYSKGNSTVYKKTRDLILKLGLQKIYYLHDQSKDIANLMNKADVVALFSKVEGLPNTICEAMQIGKPIIMSTVSDYKVLVDSSNGILCDPNDIKSIRLALEYMIDQSNDSLKSMGMCSKKKAKQLFDQEKIITSWEFLLNRHE